MHTALRIVGGLLAVLTSLIAATITAALVAALVVDGDTVRPYLADVASEATGREIEIGGLEIRRSWLPTVTVRDVVIGNPDWAAEDDMLRLGQGRVVFRLKPLLLARRLEIAELALQRPVLNLERQQDRANWQLGPTEAAAPKDRGSFPVIEHLVIEDGRLTYRGVGVDAPVEARFEHLRGRSEGLTQPVSLEAAGDYVGKPFDVDLQLGPFAQLRDETKPYPVDAAVRVGSVEAGYKGTITAPLQLKGLAGELSLRGDDLEELHALLDLPVPASPPYRLSGRLSKQDDAWRLQQLDGKLGATDVHGEIQIDLGPTPPKFVADLTSDLVDMADLKGFTGRSPKEKAPEKQETDAPETPAKKRRHLIPDEPFNLDKLRSMNVDLRFDGKSVRSGGQALDGLEVELRLQDGRLRLTPITFGIFDGTVSGDLTLDAGGDVPTVEGEMRARELHLSNLLEASEITDLSKGTFGGSARLSSRGSSLHQLAAHADGEGGLVMQGGRISNLVIELVALDLQEAIGQYLDEQREVVDIECLVTPFRLKQGRIVAEPWLFNTSDTLFTVTGAVDLGREHVRMRILPQPKDFSFFNAQTAITVTGDLTHRTASVNELAVAAKLALKTMLAPVMPLISPELEQQAKREGSCPRLLSRLTADRRGSGG